MALMRFSSRLRSRRSCLSSAGDRLPSPSSIGGGSSKSSSSEATDDARRRAPGERAAPAEGDELVLLDGEGTLLRASWAGAADAGGGGGGIVSNSNGVGGGMVNMAGDGNAGKAAVVPSRSERSSARQGKGRTERRKDVLRSLYLGVGRTSGK